MYNPEKRYEVNEILNDENAEITVNENGGKGSQMLEDFYLLPPRPMFKLANTVKYGADKYGKDNWKKTTIEENLSHALRHIFAYRLAKEMNVETEEDHLAHAMTRIVMAVDLDDRGYTPQVWNKPIKDK